MESHKLNEYLNEPGQIGHEVSYEVSTKMVGPRPLMRQKARHFGLNPDWFTDQDGWNGAMCQAVRTAVGNATDGKKRTNNPDGTATIDMAKPLGIDNCWCNDGKKACSKHAMVVVRDEMDAKGKKIDSTELIRVLQTQEILTVAGKGNRTRQHKQFKLAVSFSIGGSHPLRPVADHLADQVRYWTEEFLGGYRDTQFRTFLKNAFRAHRAVKLGKCRYFVSNDYNAFKLSIMEFFKWINHGTYNDHRGNDVPIRRTNGVTSVAYDADLIGIGHPMEQRRVLKAIPEDFGPKLSKLMDDVQKKIAAHNGGSTVRAKSVDTFSKQLTQYKEAIAQLEKDFGTTFEVLTSMQDTIKAQLLTLGKSIGEKVDL